jgi:hypothetical protein
MVKWLHHKKRASTAQLIVESVAGVSRRNATGAASPAARRGFALDLEASSDDLLRTKSVRIGRDKLRLR